MHVLLISVILATWIEYHSAQRAPNFALKFLSKNVMLRLSEDSEGHSERAWDTNFNLSEQCR